MRNARPIALAAVSALVLASCGQEKFSPHVADAMQAMRDGDRARYEGSEAAAEQDVESGWQPGGDPCRIAARDLESAGALDVIQLIDNRAVFGFSEDMRFLYTINYAGRNGFDNRRYPHTRAIEAGWQSQKNCQRDGPMIATDRVEITREYMIRAWWDDLASRYGEAAFEKHMFAAANSLAVRGIDVDWPPKMDMDYVPAPGSKS
jgi:hypothetical protein